LCETLIKPDATDAEATVLELNELWSFVLKKTYQAWIWIALCRKMRQVVAYAVGDRSEQTCRRLWEAIQPASEPFFTAPQIFWPPIRQSFQKCSTPLWEGKPGKLLMWSAGITRCDNVWLVLCAKRFFSKSLLMHTACLNLFLHRYNRERAIMLMRPTPYLQTVATLDFFPTHITANAAFDACFMH
jgi:insertion element IS1 protein InsB